MNTLQHMRVVLAIAEHGSLTAAANHLDTSLPTVVRILAATEQHLGTRLFDRTTRRVHITEEGALYVESCRRILGELCDLEDVPQAGWLNYQFFGLAGSDFLSW